MKTILRTLELLAVVILIFLTVVVFLQVVLRNFFETGFVWGEEMSRFLLLSMVLIASPIVFFHGEHVRFDLLVRKGPAWFRKFHGVILLLLVIFFYGVYIVSHLKLMKNSGNVLSPSLNIPNNIFFGAALLGAIMGVFLGIVKFVQKIGKFEK